MQKCVQPNGTFLYLDSNDNLSRNHDLPARKSGIYEVYLNSYMWFKHGREHREKNLPSFIGYSGIKEFFPKKERQSILYDGRRYP